jgi:chromosome segregation ATPase
VIVTGELISTFNTILFTDYHYRLETENKQLHQVILQLRNVRKVSKEDVDSLLTERDELKRSCDLYKNENSQLLERLKTQEDAVNCASKLQEEITEFQGKVLEYEEARRTGMLVIDEKKREVARLEKIIYDSQVANDVLTADIRMLNEDLVRKDIELQNLRNALERAESEQEDTKRILHNDFEKKLMTVELKFKTEIVENDALWEIKLKDVAASVKTTEQLLQDARILQRKAEVDLAAEKKRMQKTVEHAISQIRNTVDDVVDRALIANLLVSYFKRNR